MLAIIESNDNLTWRKVVHADDLFGSLRGDGDVADGKGGSVGSEDAVFRNVLLNFLDDLVLNVDVLEDGLDDHVGGVKPLVGNGSSHVAGDRVGFELGQLLSFH